MGDDVWLDVDENVGDVGVDAWDSDAFVSDIICMRTSKSARRGMSAVRSFCGDITSVVVYAIDDGREASCMIDQQVCVPDGSSSPPSSLPSAMPVPIFVFAESRLYSL